MLSNKVRSLFRRSSASSTQSSASSAQSSGEQLHHQQQQHSHSHRLKRKRPTTNRSRSSLVVPQAKTNPPDEPVPEEEEGEEGDQEQGKEAERQQGQPQCQPRKPHAPAPVPRPQVESPAHASSNIQSGQNLPVSAPLPLPTPEPSPLHQPSCSNESDTPTVTVQLPSPPTQAVLPVASTSGADQALAAGSASVHRRVESGDDRNKGLRLDLGGKPGGAQSAAGRRPLIESRPRSPLHQITVAKETPAAEGEHDRRRGPTHSRHQSRDVEPLDYFSASPSTYTSNPRTPPNMAHSPGRYPQYGAMQPRKRKIWVKRAGASATMVAISEDDMVDDARDMILRKYANSLGKSFDSPDVTLKIRPREQPHSSSQRSSSAQNPPSPVVEERVLRPDEVLSRTIDVYYPGGQSVEEALIIEVPPPPSSHRSRRTPKHSPGVYNTTHHGTFTSHYEDTRPTESDKDYFPVLATAKAMSGVPSPRAPGTVTVIGPPGHHPSIAVLNGAQLPALPSPGAIERGQVPGAGPQEGKRAGYRRPKHPRTHTSSPTVVQSSAHGSENRTTIPSTTNNAAPALPTPPHNASNIAAIARTATPPPPRVSSPRPTRPKRNKKTSISTTPTALVAPSSGILASVPPINVLVVEDNIINLKLLEAFLKRLKVRSQSAMNGRDAVSKWRQGGFHLVLMDIQLPLMNGLEATKEIRRLENVNGVGAFVKTAAEQKAEDSRNKNDGDAPEQKEPVDNAIGAKELFKSPVIIVALTASSLHSDRSGALAAGCNDFLTKPVNLAWLERKLKEWGCMQALIDFDGWRQWKDFESPSDSKTPRKISAKAAANNSKAFPALASPVLASSNGPTAGDNAVPSSTDPAAVISGATAPPASDPSPAYETAPPQELTLRTESTDSAATLDTLTSDDAESIDTAMPTRSVIGEQPNRIALPLQIQAGPAVSVTTPTPRQSIDGVSTPNGGWAGGERGHPGNPRRGSNGSPTSPTRVSPNGTGADDGNGSGGGNGVKDWERSQRRTKRSSLGHASGLSSVDERDGDEARGGVEVGA